MRSILNKFVYLISFALLFLSVALSGFCIFVVNKTAHQDSKIVMRETSSCKALELENQLNLVKHSVETIYEFAQEDLESEKTIMDKTSADEFVDHIRKIAINISDHTLGAMAVYFRLNPELYGNGVGGFFLSKKNYGEPFTYEPTTDILEFSEDDIEQVGWYYAPVKNKASMWMEPYHNSNINIDMISYVIPIYKNNHLIGIIGMDVDFSIFVKLAQDVKLYSTGSAIIASPSSNKNYFFDLKTNAVSSMDISEKLMEKISSAETGDDLFLLDYKNEKYFLTYQTLQNGMKLIVSAPQKEINKQQSLMVIYCLILTISILVIAILITFFVSRRIILPLRTITKAAEKFSRGDWDVEIECHTHDEVQELTTNIKSMAGKMKNYIKEINAMAYKDALTNVKNKACYLEYVEKFVSSKEINFAVAVIDVNNLKAVNDSLGHDAGDELIIGASKIICHTFSHSPVFRVGGDEFSVIITGSDYENREKLFMHLQTRFSGIEFTKEKNLVILAATGLASSPADGTDINELFKLADKRMYENKIHEKGSAR